MAISKAPVKTEKLNIILRHIRLLVHNLFQDFFANKNKAATILVTAIWKGINLQVPVNRKLKSLKG